MCPLLCGVIGVSGRGAVESTVRVQNPTHLAGSRPPPALRARNNPPSAVVAARPGAVKPGRAIARERRCHASTLLKHRCWYGGSCVGMILPFGTWGP